jgi:undecaprenyl-diphosphatase
LDLLPISFIDLDRAASLAVNGLSGNPYIDTIVLAISFLGNALIAFLFSAPIIWKYKPGRRAMLVSMLLLAVSLGVGGLLSAGIKHAFPRDRPAVDPVIGARVHDLSGGLRKNSFPSGHTITAFGTAAFLAMETGPIIGAASFIAAAAVGFARIYQGAHFPLDVAAGAIIGLASTFLVIYIARRFSRHKP